MVVAALPAGEGRLIRVGSSIGSDLDLTPGPFPAREGESARRPATGRFVDCGLRRKDETVERECG